MEIKLGLQICRWIEIPWPCCQYSICCSMWWDLLIIMFCRTSLLCSVGISLEQLILLCQLLKWASHLSPWTCLPMDLDINQSNIWYCCTFSDLIVTIICSTKLESCHVDYFSKSDFAFVRILVLWWCLVFLWNSIWISCHQILFWYSDHCSDLMVLC